MSTLKFTDEHEWIRIEDGVATIGISAYAQEQLGDIVFVDFPAIGKQLRQGDEAAVVESVKAASEIYAPIDGEVIEVNELLGETPELVNTDPTGDGWFIKLTAHSPEQADGLMDEEAYAEFVANLE